jgi:hypothetical protein
MESVLTTLFHRSRSRSIPSFLRRNPKSPNLRIRAMETEKTRTKMEKRRNSPSSSRSQRNCWPEYIELVCIYPSMERRTFFRGGRGSFLKIRSRKPPSPQRLWSSSPPYSLRSSLFALKCFFIFSTFPIFNYCFLLHRHGGITYVASGCFIAGSTDLPAKRLCGLLTSPHRALSCLLRYSDR